VQDECESFSGAERFQHHQQRRTDGIGHVGIALVVVVGGRFRDMRPDRFLAPRFAGAQHVEADPRHHRGQPSPEIVDAADIGAAEPQPGFLHRVVDLGRRAEHPKGHRSQVGAIGLEFLRQKVFSIGHIPHRVPSCLTNETGRCDGNSAACVKKLKPDAGIRQPMETMMQARMNHPAMVVPDAMKMLQALGR
jgi:hypothetical protein